MPERMLDVLLVEDDEIDVLTFRRQLDDPGVRLHVTGDVASGLALLAARFERRNGHGRWLVLLDINLPGASGLEFLARLRGIPALAMIPVVVVTTSADQRDLREAFTRHVSGYFLKPIDPAEFRRTLRAITTYWSACEMPS
jgi:CheY-like chemotaxis protein